MRKKRNFTQEQFEELLKQVVEYSLPTQDRAAKSITEICTLTGLGRTTVNAYRKIAKQRELLAVNENGHIIKSKPEPLLKVYQDILNTDFNQIPTVKLWITIIQKTIVNWQKYVANFWKVCKTINRHPDIFLGPILDAESHKDEFVKLFKEGKTVYINKKTIITPNQDSSPHPYIEAIRSFRKANDKPIPEGMLKAVQQKFDLYRKIKFSDTEIQEGIKFMAEKGKDWERLFTIHHEIGPRTESLINLQISYQPRTVDVDGTNCEYYLCDIYESKQQRHFTKIIFTPHAKALVSELPQNSRLHSFTDLTSRTKAKYNQYLREFYAMIGKIQLDQVYKKGTQEWYLTSKPSHAMRHSCIHKLMRCTGYRKEEVSGMFWDAVDTLDEYNQITPEEIIQRGTCYYCKPPASPDPNFPVFCQLNHAIRYYNDQTKMI